MNEPRSLELIKQELPTLERLIKLNARPGTDVAALALQELDFLKIHSLQKPKILLCTPESILLGVRSALKKNLTLDPYANLVYIKTRNMQVDGGNWVTVLELQESANGLISVARQCGRILDHKRPEVTKDDKGKVTGVSIELLLPSKPEPRWERFTFDEEDFERWQRASHNENGRNKTDCKVKADAGEYVYANQHYSSWRGGIDPEFARAKAVRHSLKKLGTNPNEGLMQQITFEPKRIDLGINERMDHEAAEAVEAEVISSTPLPKTEIKPGPLTAEQPVQQPDNYDKNDL